MKLANYAPAGNELLLELKEYSSSASGVLLVKPDQEKIMKVLKVGPTVTIVNPLTGKKVDVGDYCLPMSPNMMQFTFIDEDGSKVQAVQTKEFGIAAFYKPTPDETKYFPVEGESKKVYEKSRDLNVIDNPGVDSAPYLKEEELNKKFLDETT